MQKDAEHRRTQRWGSQSSSYSIRNEDILFHEHHIEKGPKCAAHRKCSKAQGDIAKMYRYMSEWPATECSRSSAADEMFCEEEKKIAWTLCSIYLELSLGVVPKLQLIRSITFSTIKVHQQIFNIKTQVCNRKTVHVCRGGSIPGIWAKSKFRQIWRPKKWKRYMGYMKRDTDTWETDRLRNHTAQHFIYDHSSVKDCRCLQPNTTDTGRPHNSREDQTSTRKIPSHTYGQFKP